MNDFYFDRDLSWLSFNERVLNEAGNQQVPLVERIRFLSIFSSNLDEFYRVRMPALMNPGNVTGSNGQSTFATAVNMITRQQQYFGKLLSDDLLPGLKMNNIHFVYNEPIPAIISEEVKTYFFSTIATFLQLVNLSSVSKPFFSENNKLYQVLLIKAANGKESVLLATVPSDKIPRIFTVEKPGTRFLVFIDDIIRELLPGILPSNNIEGIFNIKITRDAVLDLDDEFAGDLAEKIETKIATRDHGFATRFLYEPGIPLRLLYWLADTLQLTMANMVEGGKYHNLKDLSAIPIGDKQLLYPAWPPISNKVVTGDSLFEQILVRDQIIHTPYQTYDTILRFFNEAAINPDVEEVYVTLYRIAADSKIASALITAANNGKKVMVFVELKARFDEANNIRWSKMMKAAGIRIIYSIPNLKVHAKVGLVRMNKAGRMIYLGLLSTGNLNESTAKFYTDHILLTAHKEILAELEMLFIFLGQKRKPVSRDEIVFQHLLVAQFNMQEFFSTLVDKEISNSQMGLPAGITIKLNNLEEKKMIGKLYEASQAGVKVNLFTRSICCLKPGVPGLSENITVTRIVDRYLEHGRVFIFNNNNNELVYLGSADWMNRNIYSRVEVCFPVYDQAVKEEIQQIVGIQLADNAQAVRINSRLENISVTSEGKAIRSQEMIYQLLGEKSIENKVKQT